MQREAREDNIKYIPVATRSATRAFLLAKAPLARQFLRHKVELCKPQQAVSRPASRHLGGGAHTVANLNSISIYTNILSNTQWRSHLLQTGALAPRVYFLSLYT